MIVDLRAERDQIEQAILVLERVGLGGGNVVADRPSGWRSGGDDRLEAGTSRSRASNCERTLELFVNS
jgi:hypothetical protein